MLGITFEVFVADVMPAFLAAMRSDMEQPSIEDVQSLLDGLNLGIMLSEGAYNFMFGDFDPTSEQSQADMANWLGVELSIFQADIMPAFTAAMAGMYDHPTFDEVAGLLENLNLGIVLSQEAYDYMFSDEFSPDDQMTVDILASKLNVSY